MPVLRYWTGDITSLDSGACECGRTLVRMSLIKGRTDDMLIIRGVNVYPTQIETVLNAFPELAPHYRLVVTREGTLDDLEVQADVAGPASVSDASLAERVAGMIKGTVGCTARVTLVGPGEAPRSEGGKLARVSDLREL